MTSPRRNGKPSIAKSRLPSIAVAALASTLVLQTGAQAQEDSGAGSEIEEARQLNKRAFELYGQGQYDAAEPFYERALRIKEKTLGPEHPDVATDLNNLAMLYKDKGDYARAEPLFERALRIREKALGPEHPDVATSLNNLAELYRAKGDDARAEPLYERALRIKEKALGPQHPDVAAIRSNLASLGKKKAKVAELSEKKADAAPSPVGEASEGSSPDAVSGVFGLEYSRIGGSNGVAVRNVYAAAIHSCVTSFGPNTPLAPELDAVLGGGHGGLYYDLDLLLGPIWWFNQTVALAAVGGVGIEGIIGKVKPYSLKTPVRLSLSLNLGAAVRVEARAGVNWLYQPSKSGSKAVGKYLDERVAGGRIFIGRRGKAKTGAAQLALGFTYLEVLGTRTLLFMVGAGFAEDPRFE